jgi:hypothetical protein
MKNTFLSFFFWPTAISCTAFAAVWYEAGMAALLLVVILTILEITLSFDNAVVNARVLEKMTPVWQQRFLTWGIAIAVFGTRFLLPIIIVSAAVWISPIAITQLALNEPDKYGHLLESVAGSITAFGGIFLLMVSLKYFFDKGKEIHWIEMVEKRLVRWGNIEAVELAIALIVLIILSSFTHYDQLSVIIAGVIGLILFILMEGISGSLSLEGGAAAGGLSLFLYLNVLDSAFSLDGVVGAFALTTNIFIIVVGLGIGALFVRSITLYFVKNQTLTHLKYLESGAHWAILGLAISMLAELIIHVPEAVTGLTGLFFVTLAYVSSVRYARTHTLAA